jgi:hypothetical protein
MVVAKWGVVRFAPPPAPKPHNPLSFPLSRTHVTASSDCPPKNGTLDSSVPFKLKDQLWTEESAAPNMCRPASGGRKQLGESSEPGFPRLDTTRTGLLSSGSRSLGCRARRAFPACKNLACVAGLLDAEAGHPRSTIDRASSGVESRPTTQDSSGARPMWLDGTAKLHSLVSSLVVFPLLRLNTWIEFSMAIRWDSVPLSPDRMVPC